MQRRESMSKSEKMLANMRFLAKICVYFKHFLYLCIRIKTLCLVTFADSVSENLRELISTTSNVTSERREVGCLVPIVF